MITMQKGDDNDIIIFVNPRKHRRRKCFILHMKITAVIVTGFLRICARCGCTFRKIRNTATCAERTVIMSVVNSRNAIAKLKASRVTSTIATLSAPWFKAGGRVISARLIATEKNSFTLCVGIFVEINVNIAFSVKNNIEFLIVLILLL